MSSSIALQPMDTVPKKSEDVNEIENSSHNQEQLQTVGNNVRADSIDRKDTNAIDEIEEDPHLAAFRNDGGPPETLTTSTLIAIFFLGLAVVGPITCGQLMIGSVLTPVNAELRGSNQIGWVISGWGIASSVTFAVAGRLSDIFGRRYVILVGQAISVIGAIVAATAQSVPVLILGSVFLGLSIGLILVIFAAVPELCPYRYRGAGLAWIEFCLFIPWGACAVLFANLLFQHASWRWIYYVAIIYGTSSLIGTAVFYFPPSKGMKKGTKWLALKQLDFIGVGLYTIGLVLFLIGLAWGGSDGHAWGSSSVLAPLVIGFIFLAACFGFEFTLMDDRRAFFPWHLFRQFKEFSVLLILSFVAGMVYYPNTGLLPEATLFIFTNEPLQIGITLLPNGMGQLFGSTIIPAFLHLTKAPKFFIVLATFLQTLFTALYVYAIHDHKNSWMAFQFFGQGCFDWITTCTIVNASLHVRYSDIGLAIGLLGTFRSFGGSVGNAIFSTILSQSLDRQLSKGIAAAALSNNFSQANQNALIPAVLANAVGVPDAFAGISNVSPALVTATSQAVIDAYVYAFSRVFYASIPFGVIAFIASLFITDAGQYMTNHVSVQMEKNVLGEKGNISWSTRTQI